VVLDQPLADQPH